MSHYPMFEKHEEKTNRYYRRLLRKAREEFMDGKRDSAIAHLGMACGISSILAKKLTDWVPRMGFALLCYEFVVQNPEDFREDYKELVDEKIVDEHFSEGRVKEASATLTTSLP